MRFHADGPIIPDILLNRCDEGRVVFLCGAGVSVPSNMPDFVKLTECVINFFDPSADSEIRIAFQPWLDEKQKGNESSLKTPLDQIFNLLHMEYGKHEVNQLVARRLSAKPSGKIGHEHGLIKRISKSAKGIPQIVTTNFDRLFEGRDQEEHTYEPPAFPDLGYGSSIEGITYLHGKLQDPDSESHPYVLSSADFGRAYLSEGWATKFIRDLLGRYTVVLLGYKAEDPPIKYLLQGLNHDGKYDRSRLYAFDKGPPEEIEAKWHDRGVTAIAFPDFPKLWESIQAWAERADDPRKWRESVIAKTQQDPKDLAAHERGQVAHVLRTVQGAKLFSQADPAANPEWVCVMDAMVRSAEQVEGYGEDAEVFDPRAAYGLDDDLEDFSDDKNKSPVNNDDLLIWREGDDNPHDFHRIGGRRPEGFEPLSARLGHLITWFAKSIYSPVLAWWVIRQTGIHPRLLRELGGEIERSKNLHSRARHIWNLILEAQRDPRNRAHQDRNWFDFKNKVASEGWTSHVLRDFRKFATPRLDVKAPYGLSKAKPPQDDWQHVDLGGLGQFEVKFLERYNEDVEVPDEVLPEVFGIIEAQFRVVSGLLKDIDRDIYNFELPTCYPDRDVEGEVHVEESAQSVTWFIQLFDRMVAEYPELARAHATTWPIADPLFYGRLKLYAFNKVELFEADYVAEQVLCIQQEIFWDSDLVRELVFLLIDRWHEFSIDHKSRLMKRILEGPDKRSYWSDDEYPKLRDESAASYARYIQLHGCELTVDHTKKLAELIEKLPEWRESWASSIAIKQGSSGGWVSTDENPDEILSLPVGELVSKAKEASKRDLFSLTDKRPFIGLVKSNPRKALAALTISGKKGEFREDFWSEMINHFPEEVRPRLRLVFLRRLSRLPHSLIVELRFTLGRWFEKNLNVILKFDEALGWALYDHIVDGIMSGGADAIGSSRGEVTLRGKVIQQSRRTYDHAINGPIGMCTEALFRVVTVEKLEAGSLIPGHIKSRVERLFSAVGEGSDHAVSVTCRRLNWLMFIDPGWSNTQLIPMLNFQNPRSEAAWNGFLHSGNIPSPPLLEIIKPQLLGLFPKIEEFSWGGKLANVAARWLGWLRVFAWDKSYGLSCNEMRSILRAMSESTRNQFIFWLSQVGRHKENDWNKHVLPLIEEDWPRERRYRTMAATEAWVNLLGETGVNFPSVYEAVKKFLVPLETNSHSLYRFIREAAGEQPITVLFPEKTLDLMNRITPDTLGPLAYELPKVLALISETKPDLTSDPRYLRLIDLIERT